MQRQVFIFMGPPGAGKGTLSAQCVADLGWLQLSTGALCREHIAAQTEIGKQIDFIIKSGKLISDSLIIAMVQQWLLTHKDERLVILDGFPRTVSQAEAFHSLLQQEDLRDSVVRVFVIDIPDELVVLRLTSRALCSNKDCQAVYALDSVSESVGGKVCQKCHAPLIRRSDDQEDTIRARLVIYHDHARDLLSFFENKGYEVIKIAGEMPVEKVFAFFKEKISA